MYVHCRLVYAKGTPLEHESPGIDSETQRTLKRITIPLPYSHYSLVYIKIIQNDQQNNVMQFSFLVGSVDI